ncbi:unnamed protein product [Gongylonema pulchrum]|uniref:Uncharacterized protein n=1 Tax=Gongylonema pulchrum TaxID=637853 RepID=A0A183DZB9_9BILA|nr:unnamed protein product [Gongylonema pulchrum]
MFSVAFRRFPRRSCIVEGESTRDGANDEKARLERRNKLGAKILKAKLQNKMDLVEKLEKELQAFDEGCDQGPSSATTKILYRSDRGDVQMPAVLKKNSEAKGTEARGRIDSAYRADKSIRDMVAEEKTTTSSDRMLNIAMNAAKHRVDDDWVVDDAMMSVKRSRRAEEKEDRKIRNDLIRVT